MVFQRLVPLRRSVSANVEFALQSRGTNTADRATERCVMWGSRPGLDSRHACCPGGSSSALHWRGPWPRSQNCCSWTSRRQASIPSATAAIEGLVREAHAAGTKILFVTHDLGQARRLADDVVFLNHGRVMEHTDAARFFEQPMSAAAADYLSGRLVF